MAAQRLPNDKRKFIKNKTNNYERHPIAKFATINSFTHLASDFFFVVFTSNKLK